MEFTAAVRETGKLMADLTTLKTVYIMFLGSATLASNGSAEVAAIIDRFKAAAVELSLCYEALIKIYFAQALA